MSTATPLKVTEAVQQTDALRVDEENGILHDAKICGVQSKNGRIYPLDVQEANKHLYHKSLVYINHGLEPGDEREVHDHFGEIQNPYVKTDGTEEENGTYGELHYLKSHVETPAIVERARRFPRSIGLSHDAEIEAVQEGDHQKVTRITGVNSVDLVTRPATNNGIFEQERKPVKTKKIKYKQVLESLPLKKYPGKHRVLENMELAEDPMLDTPVEVPAEEMDGAGGSEAAIKAAFRQMVMAVFDDDSLDTKATSKKIGELLKQQEKLMSKEAPAAPATEEEDEEEVAESEEDDDITESEDDEPKGKVTESLRRKIKALESKLAATSKDKVIESVCKTLKITPNDRLRKELSEFRTKEEMLDYMNGGETETGYVLESEGHPIGSAAFDDMDGYEPAKDTKEFVARMRSAY